METLLECLEKNLENKINHCGIVGCDHCREDGCPFVYISEIQPTMKKLVNLLTALGYQTTDSGDGVLNVEAEMEHALNVPHVFMTIDKNLNPIDVAHKLHDEMKTRVKSAVNFYCEVSYSTWDNTSVLGLFGVTDTDLV